MIIPFAMNWVFSPQASEVDNAYALRILLDALIRLNVVYLRSHSVPGLYRSGVVYGRTTEWDTIPDLYEKRFGDCKSLSAALIAQYTMQGINSKPVFRFVKGKDGVPDFHILVETDNGFEDPSKRLGMGKNENAWFRRR